MTRADRASKEGLGRRAWRVLARQRLVHFLLFGSVLYALTPRPAALEEVELPRQHLESLLAAEQAQQGGRPLTSEEVAAVRARALEDEVLYREALRLGLDRSDALLRQHLIQKVLLLAEDLGGAGLPPTEQELRQYYEQTRSQWTVPESVRLVHVFAARPATLQALRPRVLEHEARAPAEVPPLGEPFPVSREVVQHATRLAQDFGPQFAQALQALPVGEWSEPIPSRYGWHLVKVRARSPQRPASFEEVQRELVLEYALARRRRVVDTFVERALRRYTLTVEGVPVEGQQPVGRLGTRTALSGED